MEVFSRKYWSDVFNPAMILKTSLQTVIGSVLVGSFFMVASDYIFKPTDMNGRWELTLEPNDARSMINRCVNITYSVIFMQRDVNLLAAGEKIRDRKSTHAACKDVNIPPRDIAPGKGRKIDITGFIQNNYLITDDITLSYKEGKLGNKRFTMGALEVSNDNIIRGKYYSSISQAEGEIVLKRINPLP